MSGAPDPKSRTLARGERRTHRIRASRKEWKLLRAAKLDHRACRICNAYSTFGAAPAEELHHIFPRGQGGDDVADNLVGLCRLHHGLVTDRNAATLFRLERVLTGPERAYVVGKLGEGALERLFGVTAR